MPGFPVANLGRPAFAAEARALFARFTTPPSAERKVLINNLIKSLVLAGVWAKLDAFYVMAAADSQAARRNWIADQYNLTAVASPTFTADRGYTGDGTSSYLSTGINLSTFGGKYAQNDSAAGVWLTTNNLQTNRCDFGANGGTSDLQIRARDTDSTSSLVVRSNNITNDVRSIATSVGLSAVSRSASTTTEIFKNGVKQGATVTTASVSLPNGALSILARSTTNFSINQAAAASLGSSLSATEQLALYNALNTYLTAVGAA